ncbi:MAG: hypothetical protein PUC06_01060 [Oscillospiraceae bacterium]|nr:hypothetical protein [Oscillospiraceae bacterium]
MANNYCFQFPGTKEDFMNILHEFPNNNNLLYHVDEYLEKLRMVNFSSVWSGGTFRRILVHTGNFGTGRFAVLQRENPVY